MIINKAIYASGGPGITGTKQPNNPTNSKIAQIMIIRVVYNWISHCLRFL